MKSLKRVPVFLYIITGVVLIYLLLPIIIVIPMSFTSSTLLKFPPEGFSFRWYEAFFSDAKYMRAAGVSVRVAVGTVILSTVVGTAAALGLSRKIMQKSQWVKVLLMIPMMLPAVIVGVSMYLVFAQWKLTGTYFGLIVGHTCLAIPYVVTLVSSALIGLDPSHYDAARSMGAGHWTAIRLVVLPLIRPAIFSSMLFAFITSWDETVLVLFLSNSQTMTLPRLIYSELRYGISPSIAAVSTILICITLFLFVFSRVLTYMSPQAKAERLSKHIQA